MALFEDTADENAVAGFLRAAQHTGRHALVVAAAAPQGTHSITSEHFLSVLGGAVDDTLVRQSDLSTTLDGLGHKRLPDGLAGNPEDLLERGVTICLQFLTGHRARHWGSDRLFERLPDGALIGAKDLVLLFDAKAYTDGFGVTADDTRRFCSYIADFSNRYSSYIGDVYSFLVVSRLIPGLPVSASD
jgi:hypothetical protein